jgi:hypothetical protein
MPIPRIVSWHLGLGGWIGAVFGGDGDTAVLFPGNTGNLLLGDGGRSPPSSLLAIDFVLAVFANSLE